MNKRMFLTFATFLILSLFAGTSFAQQDVLKAGRKGEVHFTSSVRVGNATLKSGMYQVQHIVEGENHMIVFKEVSMPAGYKMGGTWVGKEVARVKCKVEPAEKKFSNTKVFLRTKANGEKEIEKIQVAGEKVIHVF